MRFERPYFVTPHAVTRYRERVEDHGPAETIQERVQRGLQYRTPYPPKAKRHVADAAKQFVALIGPAPPRERWPVVITLYAYDQYRQRVIREAHEHGLVHE